MHNKISKQKKKMVDCYLPKQCNFFFNKRHNNVFQQKKHNKKNNKMMDFDLPPLTIQQLQYIIIEYKG